MARLTRHMRAAENARGKNVFRVRDAFLALDGAREDRQPLRPFLVEQNMR
jgi:hypothetical protein